MSSHNVEKTVYDPAREMLVVVFGGGSRWKYNGISQELYEQIIDADNLSLRLHKELRTGLVVGTKLTEEMPEWVL